MPMNSSFNRRDYNEIKPFLYHLHIQHSTVKPIHIVVLTPLQTQFLSMKCLDRNYTCVLTLKTPPRLQMRHLRQHLPSLAGWPCAGTKQVWTCTHSTAEHWPEGTPDSCSSFCGPQICLSFVPACEGSLQPDSNTNMGKIVNAD